MTLGRSEQGQRNANRRSNILKVKRLTKMRDAFKDFPCVDCGRRFPPECMDWDHVRGVKLGNPSMFALDTRRKFLDEIAKCELVCANCHRIRTKIQSRRRAAQGRIAKQLEKLLADF